MEHVSQQMMALYPQNDDLICKVFPSSLMPIVMRWFNGIRKGSINNFRELIQAIRARFITCSQVPQPIDALLSKRIGSGETLRSYTNRY